MGNIIDNNKTVPIVIWIREIFVKVEIFCKLEENVLMLICSLSKAYLLILFLCENIFLSLLFLLLLLAFHLVEDKKIQSLSLLLQLLNQNKNLKPA